MALIDTYRTNIKRKKDELLRLSNDKTSEGNKKKVQQQKIKSAKSGLSSTKSQSIIKSKLNTIEKAESEILKIDSKINALDKKINKKEAEIIAEEKKLRTEENKEDKKQQAEEKRRENHSKREMQDITSTLAQHGRNQSDMQKAIVDLQNIPEKIKVLFMASNPTSSDYLRLDEEARAIQEMITKSKHREAVEFVTRWAVRSSDVLQAINEVNPDVIHFSGHGTDTDKLVLQNTDGSPKYITKEAIVQTIATASDKVRLVFFNTCFSYGQAEAIVDHIEAAIGMTTSIGDDAARVFAAQFYSSIGFGCNLNKSFLQAKAALLLEGIPEEDTPVLYIKEDYSAEDIYIVRPATDLLPNNQANDISVQDNIYFTDKQLNIYAKMLEYIKLLAKFEQIKIVDDHSAERKREVLINESALYDSFINTLPLIAPKEVFIKFEELRKEISLRGGEVTPSEAFLRLNSILNEVT